MNNVWTIEVSKWVLNPYMTHLKINGSYMGHFNFKELSLNGF